MSDDTPDPSTALYAIAEARWMKLGMSRPAWCRASGLQDSTLHRWKPDSDGHTKMPKIEHVRKVSIATDVPMVEILQRIGVISAADISAPLDVRTAIARSSASVPLRTALLSMVDVLEPLADES